MESFDELKEILRSEERVLKLDGFDRAIFIG